MKILQIVCFLCCFLLQVVNASAEAESLNSLSADSVILIEASTGEVIYEKNSDKKIYPASTTKMMTTIVALEGKNLDDIVTVGKNADGVEGSSMNIAVGDRLYFKDLLYGIMMASGNDATVAVAEHMSGSVEKFAKLMTKRAHEIGANNTNFVNSSGLPDENHYSTARDLAQIARYGYRNEQFRKLVKTAKREIKWVSPVKTESLENTNLLLDNYRGANGIKTGYTKAAGECLIASAQRDDINLIAVVMHADTDRRFAEAAKLLNYGFKNVKLKLAYGKDSLVKTVFVHNGQDYKVTLRPKADIIYPIVNDDDLSNFSIQIDMPKFVQAPLKEGQQFGYVRVLYKNEEIDRVEMVADNDVNKGLNLISILITWYDALYETMKSFGFK